MLKNELKHSVSLPFISGGNQVSCFAKTLVFYLMFFNKVAKSFMGCCFSRCVSSALVAGFEVVSDGMTGAVRLVTHGNCLACPWGE